MRRELREDERGVAVIVGAILLTGLLVSAFVSLRLAYVPVWEKEAEAEHMDEVLASLAALRGALHGTFANGSMPSWSGNLPLSVEGGGLLPEPSGAHRVDLVPGASTVRVASDRFLPVAIHSSQRDVYAEQWAVVDGGSLEADQLYNLRLRINEVGPSQYNDGYARVTATDGNGRPLGTFTFSQEREPPDVLLRITTANATGTTLYSNPETIHQAGSISPYWVDVLDPNYRFSGLVARAAKPVNLTLTDHRLDAEFAATYRTTSSLAPVGGVTDPIVINETRTSASLAFLAGNVRLVPQHWSLEGGGILLAQSDGSLFRVPPALSAHHGGGVLSVAWRLPLLDGAPASVSGTDAVPVRVAVAAERPLAGFSPELVLEQTGAGLATWAALWRDVLSASGAPAGSWAVEEQADLVRVRLLGASSAADVDDVFLSLDRTEYRVAVGNDATG